jgi:hypothetical protein
VVRESSIHRNIHKVSLDGNTRCHSAVKRRLDPCCGCHRVGVNVLVAKMRKHLKHSADFWGQRLTYFLIIYRGFAGSFHVILLLIGNWITYLSVSCIRIDFEFPVLTKSLSLSGFLVDWFLFKLLGLRLVLLMVILSVISPYWHSLPAIWNSKAWISIDMLYLLLIVGGVDIAHCSRSFIINHA